MKLLTIDSSVFVAVFDSLDIFHQQSKDFFDYLANSKVRVVLPILVLFEVSNALARKKKIEDPAWLLGEFEKFELLDMDTEFLKSAFPFFRLLSIKTGDAVIAATSVLYDTKLITWDRTFRDAVKKYVSVFTPPDYVEHMNQK